MLFRSHLSSTRFHGAGILDSGVLGARVARDALHDVCRSDELLEKQHAMTGEPEPPHSISKASPKPSQSFFNQFKVIGKVASEDARHPGVALLINSTHFSYVANKSGPTRSLSLSRSGPRAWMIRAGSNSKWMCGHQMRTLGTK